MLGKTNVTITSMSATNVQGAFSGIVTGNGTNHDITCGSSNVPVR